MRVRPATRDDVPAVAALESELFGVDAWSAAAVAEELLGERRSAVVATDGGERLGYAVVAVGVDVLDLHRVAVAPAHRRTGLGRRLIAAALPGAGPGRMLLEVASGNEGARAFYRALGFEEVDRRPRYYRDGSDAVVLAAPTEALDSRSGT